MYYTCAHTRKARRLSPGALARARKRTCAVITFYFKDGRGSFAILCRTSICLIYRNYTYTDPVRFCHNLYPEYRRTRPAVFSAASVSVYTGCPGDTSRMDRRERGASFDSQALDKDIRVAGPIEILRIRASTMHGIVNNDRIFLSLSQFSVDLASVRRRQ